MARTKEDSQRRTEDAVVVRSSSNQFDLLRYNKLTNNKMIVNMNDLDLGNIATDDENTTTRHGDHHKINKTMIGRKFQYVTTTGERKNYIILSYNPTNETHRVRRAETRKGRDKIKGDHYHHKTKDVSMKDLPNIRWLDVVSVLPERHTRETSLYSSRYIGVQYINNISTMDDSNNSGCSLWKAFAPKNKDGTGLKKYVGTYRTERDAALAHDCFARKVGCSKLNFGEEFIYEEEAKKLQIPLSATLSSSSHVRSISSCENSINNDAPPTTIEEIPSPTPAEVTIARHGGTTNTLNRKVLWGKGKEPVSKYKGVSKASNNACANSPWIAQIAVKSIVQRMRPSMNDGRTRYTCNLGYFSNEIDAALAYDKVIIEYGEKEHLFKLNFPDKFNQKGSAKTNVQEEKSVRKRKNCNSEDVAVKRSKNTKMNDAKKTFEQTIVHNNSQNNNSDGDCNSVDGSVKGSRTEMKNDRTISKAIIEKKTDSCLSNRIVGDRIAFDFGSNVYFGGIVKCNIDYQDTSKWTWDILFDDGEKYLFDYNDMSTAVALYEKLKMKEMNDPNIHERIKNMKDEFTQQQQNILSQIPGRVKDRFLQVGFASWQKVYLPVMFLGPYDVSPGSVRDGWMSAFEKCNKSKVPQIVYWFGHLDLSTAFSILPESSCISLEEGERKGLTRKKRGAADSNQFKKAWRLLQEARISKNENTLPFTKIREDYEFVTGPNPDRLLVEIEASE